MMAAVRLSDVLNPPLRESLTIIRERSAASQKVPDPAQELSAHAQARAMLCVRTLDYRTTLGSGDCRLYPLTKAGLGLVFVYLVAQQATLEHVPSED